MSCAFCFIQKQETSVALLFFYDCPLSHQQLLPMEWTRNFNKSGRDCGLVQIVYYITRGTKTRQDVDE